MKKQVLPLFLYLPIIVECAKTEQQMRNTGAKDQCLEGPVIRHALATNDQEFATVTAAKTLATWNTDRDDKKIFPLYGIEELAVADTEDTYFEGNNRYKTKNGKKIRTFSAMVGLCSHNALKSFNGKTMRVYEFTDDQKVKGISVDGVKVKGQSVTVTVGKRIDAMGDKSPYTPVTLTYEDYNEFEDHGVILSPSWSHIEFQGTFDAYVRIVSASSSQIKFTVDAGCAGDAITSLEDADLEFLSPTGTAVTHTFVDADENGIYTFNGSSFASNSTIGLDGVVSKTEATYETPEVTTVTVA